MISAIVRRRNGVSSAAINCAVSTLKSFLDFEEVHLNWKKVRKVTPVGKQVVKDRAPTVEELKGEVRQMKEWITTLERAFYAIATKDDVQAIEEARSDLEGGRTTSLAETKNLFS